MTGSSEPPDDDRPPEQLDDEADRDELRRRYYGLLQELRVLLPGVQILVAFLLSVPFAARFTELDITQRRLYGVALLSGTLSIIALVAPTAFHRVGSRRTRAERLIWGIRLLRLGLLSLGISLASAMVVVWGLIFDTASAWVVGGLIVVLMASFWVLLPIGAGRRGEPVGQADRGDLRSGSRPGG